MKKLNYLAGMLAALLMIGCTSNEVPGEPGSDPQGERILKINIETLSTKTEHPGAATGSFTKVEDGAIYFFNQGGNAVYAYRLTDADILKLADAFSPIDREVTVTGVPLTATSVLLIANLNKANKNYPPFAGNTKATLEEFRFDIKAQQPVGGIDTQLPIAEVVMSGRADIVVDNSSTPATNTAAISITPVLSRLEIGAVRCKTLPDSNLPDVFAEGQITQFRLRGVFIPNHYENGTVMGIGQNAPFKSALASVYTETFPNNLSDYFTAPNTLTKKTGNYFAYHTFPSVDTTDMPNIVVAVDNIWYVDFGGVQKEWKSGQVQFITVERFNNTSTSGRLQKFDAAKIYRIKGTDPETTTIYQGLDKDGNLIKDKNGNTVVFDAQGNPIGNPVDANGKPIAPINPNDPNTGTINPVVVTLPGGSGGVEFGIEDLTDNPYDKNKTVQCNITILPWTVVEITPAN